MIWAVFLTWLCIWVAVDNVACFSCRFNIGSSVCRMVTVLTVIIFLLSFYATFCYWENHSLSQLSWLTFIFLLSSPQNQLIYTFYIFLSVLCPILHPHQLLGPFYAPPLGEVVLCRDAHWSIDVWFYGYPWSDQSKPPDSFINQLAYDIMDGRDFIGYWVSVFKIQ